MDLEGKHADLIGMCQKMADMYDARRQDADAASAAILLASVTLASLVVAGKLAAVPHSSRGVMYAVLVVAAFSAAAAAWARWEAGLRLVLHPTRCVPQKLSVADAAKAIAGHSRFVSRESAEFHAAHVEFEQACLSDAATLGDTDVAAVHMWQARQHDLHEIARKKERWIALAGTTMLAAVALAAWAGIAIVQAAS